MNEIHAAFSRTISPTVPKTFRGIHMQHNSNEGTQQSCYRTGCKQLWNVGPAGRPPVSCTLA